MRRALALLTLILGFTLLTAAPTSAVASLKVENRASGSANSLATLMEIEARLSEDAVRENTSLGYDFASDDAVAARALSAEQATNLGRFVKKLPRGAGETTVRDLPGGGKVFQAEVPGRVPGSKAVYEKQVDAAGRTVQYTKTTYDPAGNIPHVKDKITGEVFP